ncbi:uncharacterized protein LOC128295386 [Gossypium arboreum]|uniref:uncharacterized protein LOC128295386 n=1 Tax=Gossypium arboreum TaxID=29729 RepID=UPI0022F17051|nr:uncharacterized protein LOC128295386 [Gossypium arboreum]
MVADALSRKAMTDLIVMFALLSLFDDGSLLAKLQVASNRQKSYVDLKRREIEYSLRDFVFLKLELPSELDRIHDVFHISMLRSYRSDPTYVVPVEEIEVKSNLTFEEEPVQILNHDLKVLRKKSIPLLKVLWRNYSTEEAT